MTMRIRTLTLMTTMLSALLMLPACRTTGAPPAEVAGEVAAQLVAGDVDAAGDRFDAIDDDDDLEVAFTVLYEQAESLYGQKDFASASRVLRFLVEHYPHARAPKEALFLSLFLDTWSQGKPPARETLKEMSELAKGVREGVDSPPYWLDLLSVHTAIDAGNLQVARASMARFKSRWSGEPAGIQDYVSELERWLSTHGGENS